VPVPVPDPSLAADGVVLGLPDEGVTPSRGVTAPPRPAYDWRRAGRSTDGGTA
jgi:hypothetical protein